MANPNPKLLIGRDGRTPSEYTGSIVLFWKKDQFFTVFCMFTACHHCFSLSVFSLCYIEVPLFQVEEFKLYDTWCLQIELWVVYYSICLLCGTRWPCIFWQQMLTKSQTYFFKMWVLYVAFILASPRWCWCLGECLLVSYRISCCMKPANVRLDTSAIWERLIKPTYRTHLLTK